jgi:hypothetical protein
MARLPESRRWVACIDLSPGRLAYGSGGRQPARSGFGEWPFLGECVRLARSALMHFLKKGSCNISKSKLDYK